MLQSGSLDVIQENFNIYYATTHDHVLTTATI